MKQRIRKHDLVCLALLPVLVAVMALGAPYAQAQRVERFNIVPELVVSFVVRPCMLLLLGYAVPEMAIRLGKKESVVERLRRPE